MMEMMEKDEALSPKLSGRGHLLIVDNQVENLESFQRILSKQGYRVTRAASVEEAKSRLSESYFNLAIIDRRLISDHDSEDNSGIDLALTELCEGLPVLLVSGDLNTHALQRVIQEMGRDKAQFVDALDKNDTVKILKTLKDFFSRDQRNWDLHIQEHPINVAQIATCLLDRGSSKRWEGLCRELEDLFKKMFVGHTQIRIEKVLWEDTKLVALSVVCFSDDNPPVHQLVLVGSHKRVTRYVDGYEELKRFTETPRIRTHEMAETMHLSAVSFTPRGLPVNHMHFAHSYSTFDGDDFTNMLKALLTQTMPDWIGKRAMPFDPKLVEENWRLDTYITHFRAQGDRYITSLKEQISRLGACLEMADGRITLTNNDRTWAWPNPYANLKRLIPLQDELMVFHTPGRLTGENLLTNGKDEFWLTDFSRACKAPLSYPYAQIEVLIRFDWFKDEDLSLHMALDDALEHSPFLEVPNRHTKEALNKALTSIRYLRRIIADQIDGRYQEYRIALLVQLLEKLYNYNPQNLLPDYRLVQMIHIFMATCRLTHQILDGDADFENTGTTVPKGSGLVLNVEKRLCQVNGMAKTLRGQGWEMLVFLHQHAGQVVTREDLGREVYGPNFEVTSQSDTVKLNTAVNRLRKAIEVDPKNPRFLLTEQGEGYVLIPQPD